MSDALKHFPADKYEALALLYIQQQDISGLTPKELVAKYDDVLKEMRKPESEMKPRPTQQNSY